MTEELQIQAMEIELAELKRRAEARAAGQAHSNAAPPPAPTPTTVAPVPPQPSTQSAANHHAPHPLKPDSNSVEGKSCSQRIHQPRALRSRDLGKIVR